jgi:hypothetical protein
MIFSRRSQTEFPRLYSREGSFEACRALEMYTGDAHRCGQDGDGYFPGSQCMAAAGAEDGDAVYGCLEKELGLRAQVVTGFCHQGGWKNMGNGTSG